MPGRGGRRDDVAKKDVVDEAEASASAVVGVGGNEDAVGNEGAVNDESPKHAEGAASNVVVAPETAPVSKGALWKGRLDPNKEASAPL
jgi:hypothetical protein